MTLKLNFQLSTDKDIGFKLNGNKNEKENENGKELKDLLSIKAASERNSLSSCSNNCRPEKFNSEKSLSLSFLLHFRIINTREVIWHLSISRGSTKGFSNLAFLHMFCSKSRIPPTFYSISRFCRN